MDPAYRRAFGEELVALRSERELTQQGLDFATHIHRTTISLWERGVYLPSFEHLLALCDALEIQPSELLRRVEARLAEIKRSRKKPSTPKRGRPRPR